MIYNPEKQIDVSRAIEKIKHLIANKKVFELTEKRKKRTINQNAYLHLLFGWFALETGYTTEEVKQELFKKIVNPNTFYEGEFGNIITIERWRSTANLNTQEMTLCIDRFRDYASKEAGVYLPQPSDLTMLQEMEIQINNNQNYL
jgi:hypothetical protein